MDDEISTLRQQLREAWTVALMTAEAFQELGEHLTSELPFDHPARQTFDAYLPELRATIDSVRGKLQLSDSDHS